VHLGQSTYLREVLGREEGKPPRVDLVHEKRVGDFVRSLIRDGLVTAAHDLSDGGLAIGLAEMALASGIGATVNQLADHDPVALFFGEDQGRYVLTAREEAVEALLERADQCGVFLPWIGRTGGDGLKLGDAPAVPLRELKERHERWFPGFMGEAHPAPSSAIGSH
jgi:phosphoribosylformylglycinamidine synthase